MSDMPDLDRALRYLEVEGKTGFQVPAWDYAHRVRGIDMQQMRDDWAALVRLLERARENRDKRDAGQR
jgi:hypothetical protein